MDAQDAQDAQDAPDSLRITKFSPCLPVERRVDRGGVAFRIDPRKPCESKEGARHATSSFDARYDRMRSEMELASRWERLERSEKKNAADAERLRRRNHALKAKEKSIARWESSLNRRESALKTLGRRDG
jgi:multidrug resistance efflux pump